MSDWLEMCTCDNCGKRLEGRPAISRASFIISGYEPMEWRHVDGTTECVVTHKPRPYSDANQYRNYRELSAAKGEGEK